MTQMLFYVAAIIVATSASMLLWRAQARFSSLFVGACLAGTINQLIVSETYDAVAATGRMEPIAALVGSAVIAIMIGISITSAFCDWLEKKTH